MTETLDELCIYFFTIKSNHAFQFFSATSKIRTCIVFSCTFVNILVIIKKKQRIKYKVGEHLCSELHRSDTGNVKVQPQ